MIERALLSTFDKTGLAEFARGLADLGVELVASGGTADHLAEHGIDVKRVEDLTEIPELLGGRVKPLPPAHPRRVLARRGSPDDLVRARRAPASARSTSSASTSTPSRRSSRGTGSRRRTPSR